MAASAGAQARPLSRLNRPFSTAYFILWQKPFETLGVVYFSN
jgi:hypothetical protein